MIADNISNHKRFMELAIKQAKRGLDRTAPNPVVGAVIVKDNKVLSSGYHKIFGGPHAEIEALKRAKGGAKRATLYVTLEPCCHFGKTPPCTDAIIKEGVKTVVCAMTDPNPLNNGKGIKILRKKGIKVITGILKKEAEGLNRLFLERMKKRRPFVTLKIAESLDGKIATTIGDSKWISSRESRAIVQKLRLRHNAVMVGVNTIIMDNPLLAIGKSADLRIRKLHRQIIKIVVDSCLRVPLNAKIFSSSSPGKVIIATTKKAPKSKEELLRSKGADILKVKLQGARVDIRDLIKKLVQMGIGSILVEGGGELAASLLENRFVDKLYFFIAPIIIGGRDAITSVEGKGAARLKEALRLKDMIFRKIGKDFLVEADLKNRFQSSFRTGS